MLQKIDKIFEDIKSFETQRLLLIPTTKDDFEFFRTMFTNKNIMEFSRLSHKKSVVDLKTDFERILSLKERKFLFVWKVILKENNKLIGRINIGSIVRKSSRLDLGFVLLPEFWSIGIMSEAVNEIIKYLFNDINIHKITATTNNKNIRSKKLLEKFGFNLEGILKEHTYYAKQNRYIDEASYGLLKKT